jgi:hypothetical protein
MLGYDENLDKTYYIPPSDDDDDKKCWSLREACALNIETDKKIEEDLILKKNSTCRKTM